MQSEDFNKTISSEFVSLCIFCLKIFWYLSKIFLTTETVVSFMNFMIMVYTISARANFHDLNGNNTGTQYTIWICRRYIVLLYFGQQQSSIGLDSLSVTQEVQKFICYRNFQKWHKELITYLPTHLKRILLHSLLSPYESYTQYSVSKWTAKLVISYTVYNSAIPWNSPVPWILPIYCSTTLQLYQWNTHLYTTVQIQLLHTLYMARYNEPLLSNCPTSQTVTVQKSS